MAGITQKLTPAALIPLLLLPNFLFLTPLAPVASVAQTSPPSGQPLPPGTIRYTNTWNSSLTPMCPPSTTPSQALTATIRWNATIRVPETLFMGSPSGSYVTHVYSVWSNGTFSASDDSGNSFTMRPLAGLPQGVVATSLKANSTTAYQNSIVKLGESTVANVTLVYAVRHQFCQPAGVKITIIGSVNWGSKGSGLVSIPFGTKPISVGPTRILFGNKTAIALGFDWSDSLQFAPSYDKKANALMYPVGQSFVIDPTTIAMGAPDAYGWNGQRECTDYIQGYFWCFYSNMQYLVYTSSADGVTWSPAAVIRTGTDDGCLSIAVDYVNMKVYYGAGCTQTSNIVYYRRGSLLTSGAISWDFTEKSFSTTHPLTGGGVSVAIAPNGNLYLAAGTYYYNYANYTATYYAEVWRCASPVSTCTASRIGIHGGVHSHQTQPVIVAFSDSSLGLVYSGDQYTYVTTCPSTCSAWSTPVTNHDLDRGAAAVSVGTTLWYASGGTTVGYDTCSYPCSSAPTQTILSSTEGQVKGLETDNSQTLVVSYCNNTNCGHFTSHDLGASWSQDTTDFAGVQSVEAYTTNDRVTSSNDLVRLFVAGISAPYDIMFSATLLSIPTAALSTDSWSRPGLSPYESYFSHFSDYLSPGNGLVSVEAGTLDLPGRGHLDFVPSLVFSTPYAFGSGGGPYLYDNYTGASMGYGWALNFPWLGTNYLHLTDGQAFPYAWSGNTFTYHGATDFVLTSNSDGTSTLTLPSGIVFQFDSSKRLTSMTDRTGSNAISFAYGTNGYISQATDTIGRVTTFSYNTNNHLTGITSAGRTWTLGYTGSQLATLTDPLSRVTTFQYEGTSGAGAWLLSSVIWPTLGKVTYAYGSAPVGVGVTTLYATSRNVYYDSTHLSQSQSVSYTLINGRVTWSNSTISDGSKTKAYLNYNFQTSRKLMKIYGMDGSGTLQRTTEVDSDALGRTNETKLISPSGMLLAYSTASYDSWGNLKYSRDNVGQQTWYSYANTDSSNTFGSSGCTTSFYTQTISANIHNLLVGQCDYQNGSGSPQQQTYYEYATNGNLLEQKALHSGSWFYIDYSYDSYGNVLTLKNADGYITYFRYSSTYSSAYLTKESVLVGTQNVTSTYTYDSAKGFLLSATDPNGQTTSYQSDALGRITLVTYPAVGGVSSTKQYSYDDTNNILTTTDEDGHTTKQYFDGLARQTKVERWNGSSVYSAETYTYNWVDEVATHTSPAGSTYTYSYDWNGRLVKLTNPGNTYQTTSYDDVNNLKTFTDENGHQTVYAYDWNQRLISVKQYNSSTNYFLTNYSYDLSGNLLSVTDAKSQQTSYQYDDLNRLVTTTFPTSPTTTETRTYDSIGNLLTRTTANGSMISYTDDALTRLTKVTYAGSGGTVTYSYDADSNRLSMVNPSVTYYYFYDARDRLTNQTAYVGGIKYQTLYSYDAASNVVSITYPDGYALSQTYDGVNRLKAVGSFATVHYTVDDKVSTINYGNGEVATYTYDTRDRPTQIQDKYGTAKELSLNYTYDGTGNVLTINTESYGYDWLNRLTSSSGPWGTITYAYDQVGNRIRMVQGTTTTTYTYGAFNRLSSADGTTYAYDANGNMIARNGTTWTYSYDYENRLTKVTHSGTTVQTNSYDGDGNRVRQVAGSSTFTYSYQGLSILYEKNVTGSTTTVTKHFYADGLQVAKMVGTTVFYLHQDVLGNTRLVATSTVTIKFNSNYVPYGPNYAMTGSEVFMYTGKPYDSSTGLYYYGSRFYDPTTGRFITQDSYTGDRSDPMTMNLYVYAKDNPERYTDPSGHMIYLGNEGGTMVGDSVDGGGTVTTGTQGRFNIVMIRESDVDVYANTERTRNEWQAPMIGVGGGPTSASLTTTGFNWNAAESLLVLVGGTMIMTASALTVNPSIFAGSANANIDTFEYLNRNPNPNPTEAGSIWVRGFFLGFVCDFFGASC